MLFDCFSLQHVPWSTINKCSSIVIIMFANCSVSILHAVIRSYVHIGWTIYRQSRNSCKTGYDCYITSLQSLYRQSINTHMHTHTHAYTHIDTHKHTHLHTHTLARTYTRTLWKMIFFQNFSQFLFPNFLFCPWRNKFRRGL